MWEGSGGGVSAGAVQRAGGDYYLYNQRAVIQSESSLHITHTQFDGWRGKSTQQHFIRTK